MSRKIQLIAEGDGDVLALPVLVKRILLDNNIHDVQIAVPTHKRGELPKVKKRFEDYFQAAAIENYPVLCVLDFDCKTCVDVFAEEAALTKLAHNLRPNYPFQACFIVKEYESLFLWDPAAVKAILPNLRADYVFPKDPEKIRPVKEELRLAQTTGGSYKPVQHQRLLTSKINLETLRKASPSFNRLEQAVLNLARYQP